MEKLNRERCFKDIKPISQRFSDENYNKWPKALSPIGQGIFTCIAQLGLLSKTENTASNFLLDPVTMKKRNEKIPFFLNQTRGC